RSNEAPRAAPPEAAPRRGASFDLLSILPGWDAWPDSVRRMALEGTAHNSGAMARAGGPPARRHTRDRSLPSFGPIVARPDQISKRHCGRLFAKHSQCLRCLLVLERKAGSFEIGATWRPAQPGILGLSKKMPPLSYELI